MASKKSFKPPVKSNNSETVRKVTMSLTDAQYEEIFEAVIHPSQQGLDIKSPTVADFPSNKAASPKESASVENSQNSQPTPAAKSSKENENSEKPAAKTTKNTDTSTLSTINSEDFVNNTVFSTPNKIVKPKSYREALNNLKKIQAKLSDSFSETEAALNSSITDIVGDGPLSQPSSQLEKMERLLWYQKRRGTGLWVQCDNPQCDKWRWLDNADPCELPDKWYCHMNPDPAYATCDVPEKPIPLHMEADMIHNCYTAGSVVWGKVAGYPWWPAMVDDCPDEEQYYWVDNPESSDVPDWYHVVFFDDTDVTRKWLRLPQIKPFNQNPNLDKKFNIKQTFERRMAISKRKANEALKMSIKDRLKKFSFISLWKKELPNFNESDSDSGAELQKSSEKKIKKVIKKRTNATANKAQKKHKLGKNKKPKTIAKKIVSPKNKVTKAEELRRSPRRSTEKRPNSSEDTDVETNKIVERKASTNKKKENQKTFLEAEPIKPKLSRRMSTGTILKENKIRSSFKSADTTLEEESLMENVYNNCREQFMSGKVELSKVEKIYKKFQEEQASTSPKTPSRKITPLRSSPTTSTNKPIAKKSKIEKTPPSKFTNAAKKIKKSFVMPVKKSVDLNSSVTSTVSSITSGLEKLFEDN